MSASTILDQVYGSIMINNRGDEATVEEIIALLVSTGRVQRA